MNDIVTIILPVYNAEKTLSQTIDSVCAQTYTNWRLYIIDDFSADSSISIAERYADNEKIFLIKNEFNLGVSDTRNKGLNISGTGWTCFIDSDDLWMKDKLKKQMELLRGNVNNFCITNYFYVHNNIESAIKYKKDFLLRKHFLKKKFRICFSSICFYNIKGKYHFLKMGHEDFLFIDSLYLGGNTCLVAKTCLVKYLETGDSLSSNKRKAAVWHFRALQKIFNNYFIVLFYFFFYVFNAYRFRFNLK